MLTSLSLIILANPRLHAVPCLDATPPGGKYFNFAFHVDAFPSLKLIDPVKLVAAPRIDRLYVLGKEGYVLSVVNNSTAPPERR